jgi:hypothetical protein
VVSEPLPPLAYWSLTDYDIVQEDIKSVQAAPKVEAERQADTKTSGHLVNNTAGITPRKLRNYDVKSYISHASGAVAGEDVAEIEKLQKKIESLKRKKLDEASEEGKKRRRSSGFYGMKLA